MFFIDRNTLRPHIVFSIEPLQSSLHPRRFQLERFFPHTLKSCRQCPALHQPFRMGKQSRTRLDFWQIFTLAFRTVLYSCTRYRVSSCLPVANASASECHHVQVQLSPGLYATATRSKLAYLQNPRVRHTRNMAE